MGFLKWPVWPLMHAHSHMHITRAVATMDSCFGLVRPHQHGIARPRADIELKSLEAVAKHERAVVLYSYTPHAGHTKVF